MLLLLREIVFYEGFVLIVFRVFLFYDLGFYGYVNVKRES